MSLELIIRSILLGVGLAMDAFSVSLADGLSERDLNAGKVLKSPCIPSCRPFVGKRAFFKSKCYYLYIETNYTKNSKARAISGERRAY